jgi:hypothetical protein
MSGWTPSPEESGGTPGAAGTGDQPGQSEGFGTQPSQAERFGLHSGQGESFGTQPGYGPPPAQGGGYGPQPGYGTQPSQGEGFGTQAGYGTQPGYGSPAGYGSPGGYGPQPGYGTPGYAQPGPDGSYPTPPRRSRGRTWLGIGAGIIVIAVVIAGVSAYVLNNSKKWVLTAPPTVAGMSRDNNYIDQLSFGSAVAKFRSDVTSLPDYGHLKSTVSAIYTLGTNEAVGFVGFNGTFNEQVVLKTTSDLKVTSVSPGPHGGTAECGSSGPNTICEWSTGTTVGIVLITPINSAGTPESITAAGDLMVKIRDAVEQPAHSS